MPVRAYNMLLCIQMISLVQ
uniref:Uncharacterized protein n=1 Tax=Romanomermis culicivorax TaxID=13658 RepID=A0A915KH29_ROMCU